MYFTVYLCCMQKIIQLFQKHNGYLRSKELSKNGHTFKLLKELVEEGKVEKIKPGLYRHLDYVTNDELFEVSKMYPKAVICLFSAWYYYELTTHIPTEYHLAIPNKMKLKPSEYPPVQFYYWDIHYFEIEIVQDNGINIYSLEKSVCDAVRFKNKIGADIFSEVVKNYVKRKDKNISKLIQVAKQLKVEKQVRNTLDLLL
jgi:predicted transcriptional regulator of viral defense system